MLVELDTLVSVRLGITADQFVTIYKSRYHIRPLVPTRARHPRTLGSASPIPEDVA